MHLEHDVSVSISSTRRRLRKAGHIVRKPRNKPRLTSQCKKARLEFASIHKDWTAEQWSEAIFSDESWFRLHRSEGRVYVRRIAEEGFMEDCVLPTVKQ